MSNRFPHEPSLDEIFDEEARELFERLDHEARRAPGSERERRAALATLHTLKGSARAVERFELARRAHQLEAEIQPLSPGSMAHEAIDRARAELEHLLLGGARPALRDARPGPGPEVERDAEGVVTRLSESRYDRLMELACEVATSQSRLATDLERLRDSNRELELAARRWRTLPAAAGLLETVAARELLDDLAAVRTGMADALRDVDAERRRGASAGRALQQDLVRARLTRFDDARERFERVLRDAARTAGTRCELELTGGDTTLDRALHRELLAPLEHLLRNAAVHGIETPDVRAAAGKATTGRVRLGCGIDGIDLVIDVTDDGRGLDPATALATSTATLLDTLAESGFTTLDSASAVAGRGLGVGAVKSTIETLGGTLRCVDESEGGMRWTLRVPQRMLVHRVLLIEARGLFAIPVGFVKEIHDAAALDGGTAAQPLRPLATHLDGFRDAPPDGAPRHDARSTTSRRIVLVVDGRETMIDVDAVAGYHEMVVQPLGPQLASLGLFSGGCVLADGRRVLVLDPARLSGRAPPRREAGGASRARSERPLALIVDDSPTQRAWLERALASLGVRTRTARDGIEALERLGVARPDVLVVDIDMPRLDGFGLLAVIAGRDDSVDDGHAGQRRPPFDERGPPPVIVVSSRSSGPDRRRARELGASRFIAKPGSTAELHAALRDCGVPAAGP